MWNSCCPRESQEPSPASQFEIINSLALSRLSGPVLTSVHDTGKTVALSMQTFISKMMSLPFKTLSCEVCHSFPSWFFDSSSLSAFRVESSSYLRLLIFLLVVLSSVCNSSSLAFCMMYFAYKLNKQGFCFFNGMQ